MLARVVVADALNFRSVSTRDGNIDGNIDGVIHRGFQAEVNRGRRINRSGVYGIHRVHREQTHAARRHVRHV